ncbi:MAG TPA: hypothetical protein VKI40_09970 [Terriglobales bacterium]|jgi:hypothetical protein|nr:hypothetical protein [Terriglobales bacterium]
MSGEQQPMRGPKLHSLRAEPRTLKRVRTAVMLQAISINGAVVDHRVLLSQDLAVPIGEIHAFDSQGMLIAKYKLPEHLL